MAVPKGKLVKLSSAPVILHPTIPAPEAGKDGESGPPGPPGLPGRVGESGRDGKDGRDAPTLDEVLQALRDDPSLSQLIVDEVGKRVLEGQVMGGAGRLDVQDLPGYRGATSGDVFAVGSNGKVGFYSSEEIDVPKYTRLIDTVAGDPEVKYVGEALPGTATSSATWRIKKATYDVDEVDWQIEWADGVSTFTKTWDDRLTYTYS